MDNPVLLVAVIVAVAAVFCTVIYFFFRSGGVDYSASGRSGFSRGGGSSRDADFCGGGASGRWQQHEGGYKDFLYKFDGEVIVAAIRTAEEEASGGIRVSVSKKHLAKDAIFTEALRHFRKLGMHRTAHRSAVLIFIAPNVQEFAVVADEGIQAKCGAAPWRRATTQMREAFEKGDFTGGVASAITAIGKAF